MIKNAAYKRKKNTAEIAFSLNGKGSGFLRMRVKTAPGTITLNGEELSFKVTHKNKLELLLKSSGTLKLEF